VNALVDGFNELLSELASGSPSGIAGFHHVDFRNTLSINEWADELHPIPAVEREVAHIHLSSADAFPNGEAEPTPVSRDGAVAFGLDSWCENARSGQAER
jgi:hypothetical protein